MKHFHHSHRPPFTLHTIHLKLQANEKFRIKNISNVSEMNVCYWIGEPDRVFSTSQIPRNEEKSERQRMGIFFCVCGNNMEYIPSFTEYGIVK